MFSFSDPKSLFLQCIFLDVSHGMYNIMRSISVIGITCAHHAFINKIFHVPPHMEVMGVGVL
jgi:hypothetical protein